MRVATVAVSAAALLSISFGTLADPYTYYGGTVPATEKNPAVEACEYRELVEEQRCNNSLNKRACIDTVHAECLRTFGTEPPDEASGPGEPDAPRPQAPGNERPGP